MSRIRARMVVLALVVLTGRATAAEAVPPRDDDDARQGPAATEAPAAESDPPVHLLVERANEAIESFAAARTRSDEPAMQEPLAAARSAAGTLDRTHGYSLAARRLDTVEAWNAGQAADAVENWARLARLEVESVLADPEEIGTVLEECRALGDRWCEARALLARAEALNEASLPQEVQDDTAAAETIFRAAGPSERLGRTLVLRRGSGVGGGEAAIEAARERYAEAILIAQQVGDPALEGRALCERVRLEIDQQQMAEAAADLERMKEIVASGNRPRVAACAGYREGFQLYLQRNPIGAADRWREVAESDAVKTAPREAVWSLVGVTALSINASDGAAALRWARKAVDVADRLNGSDDRGRAYCNLTTALVMQERFKEVEEAAGQCLAISRDNDVRNGEEIALRGLGYAARNRGENQEALELFRQSLAITQEIRNPVDGIWNLLAIGQLLEENGDLSGAGDHYRQAVETADWLKWPDFQAMTRAGLARVLVEIGEIDEAVELVEAAMSFPSPDGSIPVRPWTLQTRGLIHTRRQEYSAALEAYRLAYDELERRDHPGSQSHLAIDIGNVYFRLSRLDRASEYYERAVELATNAGNAGTRLVALGNIALLKRRGHSFESAIAMHREVIREAKRAGKTTLATHQTIQLADALKYLKSYDEAEQQARGALALARESNDRISLMDARRSLGDILSLTGGHQEAISLCEENLRLVSNEDPHVLMDVRWTCGWIRLHAGQPARAVDEFRTVIRMGEESRRWLGSTEMGTAFLADRVAVHSDLVHALIETAGSDLSDALIEEVFEISESFRARTLLAALAPAPRPADTVGTTARADLLGRMAEQHLIFASGEVGREQFLEEIRRLEDGLVEMGTPGGSSMLLGAEPIDLATALASIPDEKTAVLEYLLGGESSYALVLTRERAAIARLEGGRWEHFQAINRYRSLLESRGSQPDRDLEAIASLGRRIYLDLVAPALQILDPGINRLVIVGDGPLYLLPFEALVLPKEPDHTGMRFLVEEFEVATVPSLSVLAQLGTAHPGSRHPRSLTAFANPDLPDRSAGEAKTGDDLRDPLLPTDLPPLPYSEEEVRNAARRLGGEKRTLSGPEATEWNAREALQAGFPIVHFATHGFLDPQSIGRSGLVLTPDPERGDDGLLQARELINLRADTDLVVLSGCSTGVGRIVGGEGALGLPHSLFQAGVPSVVHSLWEVRDRAAALFMERFYAGLSEGKTLGEAMRAAKLELLRSNRAALRHPAVWAPFVLSGVFDRRLDLPRLTLADRFAGGNWAVVALPIAFLAIGVATWWGVRRRFRSG